MTLATATSMATKRAPARDGRGRRNLARALRMSFWLLSAIMVASWSCSPSPA